MSIKRIIFCLALTVAACSILASPAVAGWFGGDGQPEKTVWPTWSMEEVTAVTLVNPSVSYTLLKLNGEWFVTPGHIETPLKQTAHDNLFRADPAKVESLLAVINRSRPDFTEDCEVSDKEIQQTIEKPYIALTIFGPERWDLKLGKTGSTPLLFGLANGAQEPFALDLDFASVLNRRMEYYQDLRLIPLGARDINTVRLTAPNGNFWAISRSHGGFAFVAPEKLVSSQVDESEMEYYIHSLSTMKALSLLPETSDEIILKDFPDLDKSAYVITVSGPDEQQYQVKLYRTGTDAANRLGYSSWQNAFFLLSAQRWEALISSDQDMRRRLALDFMDISSVVRQRITLKRTDKEGSWTFRRTFDGWEDELSGHESSGLDLLLWRLSNLKYEGEPLSHLPKDRRLLLDWELMRERGDPVVLHFYAEPNAMNGFCLMKVAGTNLYYLVSSRLLMDVESFLPNSPGVPAQRGKTGRAK